MTSIGRILKQMRLDQELTLQQLSEKSGTSVSFLSQLENDQANPTLTTLRRVAEALGSSMFAVIAKAEERKASIKIALDTDKRYVDGRFNTFFTILSQPYASNRLQALQVVLEPNMSSCDEPTAHGTWDDEEWSMVLSGEVEIEIGNDKHILQPGECVHFNPATPHRYTSVGEESAVIVSVMCPPPI